MPYSPHRNLGNDAYWESYSKFKSSVPTASGTLGAAASIGFTALSFGVAGAGLGAAGGILAPITSSIGFLIGSGIGLAFGVWNNWDAVSNIWSTATRSTPSTYEFRRPFVNTRQAATMRQAGMQSILSSGRNYRQFFGREAQTLHR